MSNMKNTFDAAVFDVDGVLVESEPLHMWAWGQVLARYGIKAKREDLDRFIGISCTEVLKFYQGMVGKDHLPDSAYAEKQALFNEVMPTRLKPVEGAVEVVEAIHRRGIPLGAASNSPSDRVREMLDSIGILRYFSVIAGIDEVREGKPAPDVYLLACSRLGVQPSRCFAVDDSPTGVTAAAAAGMTVWGYVSVFSVDILREAGAHLTIDGLPRILDIIGQTAGVRRRPFPAKS